VLSPIKNNTARILLFLFLLSLFPFALRLFQKPENDIATNEMFNKGLSRLNTSEKMLAYVDSSYASAYGSKQDTATYVLMLSKLVKERFVHGTLNYSFSDNWIAWVCGKLFWSHFSSMVLTEDILKHTRGLCSQQTMVFMNLLKKKGINARSVGLGYKEGPGHFLCEVSYNGAWHLHDVTVEPAWSKIKNHHFDLDYYLGNLDSLYLAYESRLPRSIFYKIMEKHEYGAVNQIPAGHMRLFQYVTETLTYIFPVVFLLLFLYYYKKQSAVKKAESKTEDQEVTYTARQVHAN
jgi:hypothetical protein